ncbi:hypothetical protein RIF29_21319 [Crotalaria pallida]|uniref:RPW8 domain-containing protein n=1 Tax=Crotalaria pallida TaxID=3830 RepID=A0AAN9F2T2_CROPI
MAMLLDAAVGAVVGELLSGVLKMKDKAVEFRPTLERLETTLESTKDVIRQIESFNRQLDRPKEEMERLKKQMECAKEMVSEYSKVRWWKCCWMPHYQEELEALDGSIRRFFELDMQVQTRRDVAETLVEVKEIRTEIRKMSSGARNDRIELGGLCSPPEPPSFTVGLDISMRKLRLKLLQDQVGVSVINVTGSGGSGKSTLAKMLCRDDQVKGKFKDKIFFLTFGRIPKLNSIVQKLFQHTGYQVPEPQSDDDAINQLEHLLKEIGKSPILLVLDDVWPGSESLVENFVFQISGYKILVTSRFSIERFGPPYVLKPLGHNDATKLFRHSASLNQSKSDVPDDVVKKIVRGCRGSPFALIHSGRSLSNQNPVIWHNRARNLSKGHSVLDYNADVLACLQKNFDILDPNTIECFMDLSLFLEDQRIPAAALVDMWAELLGDDDASAMERIYQLVNLNMADIIVTRKVANGAVDYNYHYVTQHGLLRDLAIRQTNEKPVAQRNRLIIDLSGLPKWWTEVNEHPIKARILSVSIDETFTSDWSFLQPTGVEVLVLNLRAKKCTLPVFMKKMSMLKVLIIANYDFYHADLENVELFHYLSDLKRLRLEKVSIPFLGMTGAQLKNLQKLSLFMCNVDEAFKNSAFQISDMMPNLVEINIDYCNMVELPDGISNIVFLRQLSITSCHKLSALPDGIGNLVNLESLRLSSSTGLKVLPDSVAGLRNLKLLDISGCISLNNLPENIGELSKLEKLNVKGCSGLSELPTSVMDLGSLRHVVCDEETSELWELFTSSFSDLRLEVVQADDNTKWLGY